MSAFAYYSPFWLGTLLSIAVAAAVYDELPLGFRAELSTSLQRVLIGAAALLIGGLCQLAMLGIQGATAQVLPLPVGRSIRGRGAASVGILVLIFISVGAVAGMLWAEQLTLAWRVAAGLSLAAGVSAVIGYVWCVPAALRDFGKE